MKYFICPCIFESKLGCSFVKIGRLIEEGFIDFNFLTFLKNDCCYICCKKGIYFRFECSRSEDIQATCGNIKYPVCCFNLIEFGYENMFCKCENLLFCYFTDILIELE